ncbi:hypothetical protein COT64_01860 [Candidatus Shapirobacteria bacterium CG09_land_8_20_14_0_10_39_12]|uniref:Uncharacterized protein n=1 Tax=Candidatus Shapirobacteria bacterium CG09_land_8_20_14_0_10_39_12 TaxID=1974885 RepID=A0A2H0WPM3_9BACT|nr:MAG: hypothetical protein COT64_01860 [Candidatus Shapirobacteria bacterium CG09_land_8_20_14_0_10_39_12]
MIFLFVFLKVSALWETDRKYRSIDSCGKTGSVSYKTPDGATINEPSKEWYEKCLKDKGIR